MPLKSFQFQTNKKTNIRIRMFTIKVLTTNALNFKEKGQIYLNK